MKRNENYKIFIGIILLFIGVSIFLSSYFNLSIPIFRTLISIILILAGIFLLMGKNYFIFSNGKIKRGPNDYLILFSSTDIDLSDIKPDDKIIVDVIFADCKIYLKKENSYKVMVSSIMADVKTSDENFYFGSKEIHTGTDRENESVVIIMATFSSVKVEIK